MICGSGIKEAHYVKNGKNEKLSPAIVGKTDKIDTF